MADESIQPSPLDIGLTKAQVTASPNPFKEKAQALVQRISTKLRGQNSSSRSVLEEFGSSGLETQAPTLPKKEISSSLDSQTASNLLVGTDKEIQIQSDVSEEIATPPESKSEQPILEQRAVLEKLKPYEIKDADGAERQVFTFTTSHGGEIQTVFYTREELPFSAELLQGKSGFILGEPPRHRKVAGDWDEFRSQVRQASQTSDLRIAFRDNQAVLFVENTPVHILDLAFHLGLNDPKLRDARKAAAVDKTYTDDTIKLLDDLVAGTMIDDEGILTGRNKQEGEALTVLALLGDEQARAVLDKKKAVLENLDQEEAGELVLGAQATKLQLEQQYSPDGLKHLGKYWATHVTQYKPIVLPEGIEIKSAFDGSDGKKTRDTIHFSLDSAVSPAMGGPRWDKMPYVVSGDLSQIREANGNPQMMAEVDTYFTVNPGQRLKIPNARLRRPGSLPEGIIRQTNGNETVYKSDKLTPADIHSLFEKDYEWMNQARRDQVAREFVSRVAHLGTGEGSVQNGLPLHQFMNQVNAEELFKSLQTTGIDATVDQFFGSYEGFNDNLKVQLAQNIESWLVLKIRDESFLEGIGNGEYTIESARVAYQAAKWGADGVTHNKAHFSDPYGGRGLENIAGNIFESIERQINKVKQKYGPSTSLEEVPLIEQRITDLRSGPGKADLSNVVITDRASIMEAFRKNRIVRYKPAKQRRMFYVAGVI